MQNQMDATRTTLPAINNRLAKEVQAAEGLVEEIQRQVNRLERIIQRAYGEVDPARTEEGDVAPEPTEPGGSLPRASFYLNQLGRINERGIEEMARFSQATAEVEEVLVEQRNPVVSGSTTTT